MILTSNNPILLNQENKLFKVKKGKVNIFAKTKSGKKHYVTSFSENEIFFSLEIFYNEEFSLEVFSGTVEPMVELYEYKKEDNEKIITSLSKFNSYLQYPDISMKDLDKEEDIFITLSNIFDGFVKKVLKQKELEEKKELNKLKNEVNINNSLIQNSLNNLTRIFNERSLEFDNYADDDLLLSTIMVIAKKLNIKTKTIDKKIIGTQDPISDISKALNIKVRPVNLTNDWHKKDAGILLGFTKEQVPVCFIPIDSNSYKVINLEDKSTMNITDKNVSSFVTFAYMFYRPLPQKSLTKKDIFTFISFENKQDFLMMITLGIISGLIALVTPLVIGELFDNIIPQAEKSQLVYISLVLLIAAFTTTLFTLVRGFALSRIKNRISLNLQAAIWDRLVNLPTSFFRKYSTGDLALRANGINQIQEVLSGSVMSSIIGGIFSIFSFLLLFKYSTYLAFVGLGLVLLALFFNLISTLVQIKYKKKILAVSGELSSFLLELLSGIQKIKIANATKRVYSKWADGFYIQRKLYYKSGYLQNYLEIFNIIFPLFVSIVIFSIIAFSLKDNKGFSTGEFIAFNAAFSQFLVATLSMSNTVLNILNITPLYERIKPILEEVPEINLQNKNPGKLKGEIEIKNLSFRYNLEGKKILDDVSMNIKDGEFIAIVGSSGSGKSTLLRLLLGFEKAEEGNIFYDNQNLEDIDISAVRSQLGVVLQNGMLTSGSIFTNIIGATNKTLDDAWEAAKKVGFEEDIKSMPMEMNTVISNGGSTLSGGQRQRLLIARALINNPRIIYFDEATSALDNKTQSIVTNSLDGLNATRIVIAHRLSTIVNANKIFVLENGKITQQGTYEELMKEQGLFKELALRQLA